MSIIELFRRDIILYFYYIHINDYKNNFFIGRIA